MRKIIYALCTLLIVSLVSSCWTSNQTAAQTSTPQLYFVDSHILRLIPVDFDVGNVKREKAAKIIVSELIKGRDDNKSIRRLIPNIKNGMSVKVKNNIAHVNLTSKFVEKHPDGRDLEILTIYSIVNSLTSIDGINVVKFTIDGKEEKKFKGYLDMRESFIPDYMI